MRLPSRPALTQYVPGYLSLSELFGTKISALSGIGGSSISAEPLLLWPPPGVPMTVGVTLWRDGS